MVCRRTEKGQEQRERERERELLDQKYGLRRKGITLVMEWMKQRITAKVTKIKQYDNKINQL